MKKIFAATMTFLAVILSAPAIISLIKDAFKVGISPYLNGFVEYYRHISAPIFSLIEDFYASGILFGNKFIFTQALKDSYMLSFCLSVIMFFMLIGLIKDMYKSINEEPHSVKDDESFKKYNVGDRVPILGYAYAFIISFLLFVSLFSYVYIIPIIISMVATPIYYLKNDKLDGAFEGAASAGWAILAAVSIFYIANHLLKVYV